MDDRGVRLGNARSARWMVLLVLVASLVLPLGAASAEDDSSEATQPGQSEPVSPGADEVAVPVAGPTSVPPGTELTVLTKNIEPFIFGDSGIPSGFSADIWNEITRRLEWRTTWVWTDAVADQIQQVTNAEVDAAIAAISMTPERELQVDFTHRLFSSGLQIMTKPASASVIDAFVATIFTPALFKAFAVVAVTILVIGHIVWLVMRKREDFPNGYLRGVGQGMWLIGSSLFVSSRISVVFFQGKEPSKVVSRVLIILWMAMAVIIISYVNGTITATLTVTELRSDITGPSELPGVRVTTVQNTQASTWLRTQGIDFIPVEDVEAGISRLEDEKSDAFVFDSPILKWERAQRQGSGLEVVGEVFDPIPYGIALPSGSPLREQINTTMLEILNDGTYERILRSYGGGSSG